MLLFKRLLHYALYKASAFVTIKMPVQPNRQKYRSLFYNPNDNATNSAIS